MNLLLTPIPFDEAADLIKDKPVVLRRVWDKMLPEIRARVFMVTGIEDANMAQAVRDIIAEVPRGRPWDEAKADVVAELQKLPWMDAETAVKRAELLVRHHAFMAYSAAQYEAAQEVKQDLPYWQYLSMGDEAVRDAHRRLHGLILPADHPFWEDHYPPWDWGCRCQVVPISAEDAAQAGAGRPNEYGVTLGPEQEKRLRETGMLDLGDGQPIDTRSPRALAGTPKEKTNAWQWTPGDLRIPIDALRERYEPEVFARFEAAMKQALIVQTKVTVWEWLNGAKLIVPPSSPASILPPRHETVDGVFKALGLDAKKAWSEQEIDSLYKTLQKESPATLKRLMATAEIQGADKKGAFSSLAVTRHARDVIRMLPPNVASALSKAKFRISIVNSISGDALADYNFRTHEIRLSKSAISQLAGRSEDLRLAVRERIFHEMGHWIHMQGPAWYRDAIDELWGMRTSGEKMVSLPGYGCRGKRDRWYDEYAGRDDYGMPYHGLEAVTRHFQLLANPKKMVKIMRGNSNGDTIAENLRTILRVFMEK